MVDLTLARNFGRGLRGIVFHNRINPFGFTRQWQRVMMDPHLFVLWRDFFALAPINRLEFPEKVPLSLLNRFFVNDILLDHHFRQYSPSVQYQIGFWKWAIQHLEVLVYSEEQVFFNCSRPGINCTIFLTLIYDRKTKLLRQYTNIMLI